MSRSSNIPENSAAAPSPHSEVSVRLLSLVLLPDVSSQRRLLSSVMEMKMVHTLEFCEYAFVFLSLTL